jgi:sec-independent protein translocase protein TatB
MFGLGLFEILFIAVLGLLLIGPEQLPEVTKALARFLTDIRRSTNALKSDFEAHSSANLLKIEEERIQTEKSSQEKVESPDSSGQMSFDDVKTPAEASHDKKTESES